MAQAEEHFDHYLALTPPSRRVRCEFCHQQESLLLIEDLESWMEDLQWRQNTDMSRQSYAAADITAVFISLLISSIHVLYSSSWSPLFWEIPHWNTSSCCSPELWRGFLGRHVLDWMVALASFLWQEHRVWLLTSGWMSTASRSFYGPRLTRCKLKR